MGVVISGVEPGSIAARKGIAAGLIIWEINGHPIADVLDYRFHMTSTKLSVRLCGPDGKEYNVSIRKGEYDDLGLVFDSYLMDQEKSCRNKCCFCFIDQLPSGLRESLYFKDDDSRLGFLFGNYITLTNLENRDIERLIAMRISPINISVHTMNPELRVNMMKNPQAGEALRYIPALCQAGIKVNAQLVLCPDINDGPELEHSLRELSGFGTNLQSVSCVPVGITKYREGLPALRLHTKEEAAAVVETVARFASERLKNTGSRTFFAADEFYLKAELPLPDNEYYEDYYQLENGVGMVTLLEHEFLQALEEEPPVPLKRRITLATGMAAAPLIKNLAKLTMAKFPGLEAIVVPVENKFFGETITVAGLLTAGDVIEALNGRDLGEEVLLPASMLRREGDLFLDGISLEELSQRLGKPVKAVANDGYELLAAMLIHS